MMNKTLWEEISSCYAEAGRLLWNTDRKGHWGRNDEKGMACLWRAYDLAKHSEEKDNLLYARILLGMHRETMYGEDEHGQFRKYIAPAKEAYDEAAAECGELTEKELEWLNYHYDCLKYDCEMEKWSEEKEPFYYSHIEGMEKVPCEAFQFHDAHLASFELQRTEAALKLEYEGSYVTFHIDGIVDLKVQGDQYSFVVNDFYCYPAFHDKSVKVFGIGFMQIMCDRIAVTDIQLKEQQK